jgi:hypothetical protein
MDVETDLVDKPGFEQRARQFAAPHQADVLARALFQIPDERHRVVRDDVGPPCEPGGKVRENT